MTLPHQAAAVEAPDAASEPRFKDQIIKSRLAALRNVFDGYLWEALAYRRSVEGPEHGEALRRRLSADGSRSGSVIELFPRLHGTDDLPGRRPSVKMLVDILDALLKGEAAVERILESRSGRWMACIKANLVEGPEILRMPAGKSSPPLTIESLREKMAALHIISERTFEEIGRSMNEHLKSPRQTVYSLLQSSENPGVFTLQDYALACNRRLEDLLPPLPADASATQTEPLKLKVLRTRMAEAVASSKESRTEIGARMGMCRRSSGQNIRLLLEQVENPGIFTLDKFARATGTSLERLLLG